MSNENKQNDERAAVPTAWKNTFDGLLAYVLQDDLHNRLTPRIIDIAYTAFMSGATGKNTDDGGKCDWLNDTRPAILDAIAKLSKDLDEARATQQATKGDERAAFDEVRKEIELIKGGAKHWPNGWSGTGDACDAALLALARATTPSTVAESAIPDDCDVRKILLRVVPGDGDGHEVYAKNVGDVEELLANLGEQLDALQHNTVAGNAERAPDAELVACRDMKGSEWFDIKVFNRSLPHGAKLYAAPSLATDAGAVTDLAQRCRELIELAEIGESKQETLRALADTYHPDIAPHDRRAMAISQTHLEAARALLAVNPTEQRMSDAATEEQPSWTNPMTPYGMLVRALRIVVGTTLMDMATFLGCSPAQLSALEFGRKPVTNADIVNAAHYFASFGINSTTHALTLAARKAEIERSGVSDA